MYPQFCAFPVHLSHGDRYLDAVAADFGLGSFRPGVIMNEQDDMVEVITAVDGRTSRLPTAQVRRGLNEGAALALMDALEEAIEDTLEAEPLDAARLARLEENLSLLERCVAGAEEP
ncbi:MAG: hypothetical protein ACRDIE_01945 [Chloroflexota bacterium]